MLDRLALTSLAGASVLLAQLDQHDDILLPYQVRLERAATLLEPNFSDYARGVRDLEIDFLLTERGQSDWSVRRCALTDTALQFGRPGRARLPTG